MFDLEFLAVGLFVVVVLMVVVRIFAGWRIWKLWKANTSETGGGFKFEDQDSGKAGTGAEESELGGHIIFSEEHIIE